MIPVPFLSGKRVVVMGLGKSGMSTARALVESGVRVSVWDDGADSRQRAEDQGLTVADPMADGALNGVDLVVWSPGIPHTHPVEKAHPLAARARALGIGLVCDVELLALAKPGNRFLAVTGTNGKSTTTTLLAHVLEQAGRAVAAGGNLGTAALDMPDLDADGRYVLELSSYQLELIQSLRPLAGVLLNITPDHLARHGGLDGYVAAKRRLFQVMDAKGVAVIGVDDEHGVRIADEVEAQGRPVVRLSVTRVLDRGISAPDGILREDGRTVADLTDMGRLPGRHNWQNACAVYALARADGVAVDDIILGFATYPGLAHRQELVGMIDDVAYVNDSKATNADATEKALVCYDRIYWILGGQPKEGGIDSLVPHFHRIAHAFLIGDAAQDFAQVLERHHVSHSICGELITAVSAAHARADAGSVVLLSPACASWDQFKSFEHRGDVFRQLVEQLL